MPISNKNNHPRSWRKIHGSMMEERRIMDKYTKFILTMIAVALFGLNYHLFGGDIISKAEASHTNTSWGNHIVIENWPDSITCK